MFQFRLPALIICIVAYFTFFTDAVSAEVITIKSSHSHHRNLQFEEFRGLPRLGYQDTSGLSRLNEQNIIRQGRINKNKALADKVGKRLEKHNYSIALLARLAFINQHPECFKNMDGYEVRTENCEGLVIEHSQQKNFWNKYIETMALSLTPAQHIKAFCFNGTLCFRTQVNRITKSDANGRSVELNEFERRDFVSGLIKGYYYDFEKCLKNISFHKDAYMVSVVRLGDYDFDQNKFHFKMSLPVSLKSQNNLGVSFNNTLNSRNLSVTGTYTPTLGFEKKITHIPSERIRSLNIDLPMDASKARKIVQNNNLAGQVYAVTRVVFLDKKVDKTYQLFDKMSNPDYLYHFAENKVELFKDQALTQKIAEIPLVQYSESKAIEKNHADKYIFNKNSRFLDYLTFSLFRYKKGDLLSEDIDKVAYGIQMLEKKFWIEHKERMGLVNKLVESGGSKEAQERYKNNKKRALDRAKISNFSWQDIGKLSTEQKQAFYNYMLGFDFVQNNEIVWPDILPSVPWGMNLATVFRKGYFSDKKEDMNVPADNNTKVQLQKFLHDIANSQTLNDLVLLHKVKNISYNKESKMLVINQKSWPFQEESHIEFTNGKEKQYKGRIEPLVSPKAKNRAIYRLRSSDGNIGEYTPNLQYRYCNNNQNTKSKDCRTAPSTFSQLTVNKAYLALDREISLKQIPMSVKDGTKLVDNSYYNDLKLVVELINPNMDVIQFNYKEAKTHKNLKGESQTLFANVKRVLLLAPDDSILWSEDGINLSKPTQKKISLAREPKKEPLPNISAKTQKNTTQQKNEALELKKQNKQCLNKYKQETKLFEKCKELRANLVKAKAELKQEEEKKCKSTISDRAKLLCKITNETPLNKMSEVMSACIEASCGTNPATVGEVAEFQKCIKSTSENMKRQMSEMMGLHVGKKKISSDNGYQPPNICKVKRFEVKSYQSKMETNKCNLYIESPKQSNCNVISNN